MLFPAIYHLLRNRPSNNAKNIRDYDKNEGVKVSSSIAVSIIIPTYNSEKYVEKCLTSVIMQTLNNIEIIIIDNISDDNTVKVVKDILSNSKKKFDIITNPKLGVSSSRNIGIKASKGEYIYFLDSDDYFLEKEALENVYNFAKVNDLDIAHFGFNRVDDEGKIIVPYNRFYKYITSIKSGNHVLEKYLKGKVWLWTGNCIYKMNTIKNNSLFYTENCVVGEDQEFIIKTLVHSKRISSVNKVYINYVSRKESLSKNSLILLEAVETFERIKSYLKSQDQNYEKLISIIDS
jgi:glycosyltransferase involved in cell wall biosynthesis